MLDPEGIDGPKRQSTLVCVTLIGEEGNHRVAVAPTSVAPTGSISAFNPGSGLRLLRQESRYLQCQGCCLVRRPISNDKIMVLKQALNTPGPLLPHGLSFELIGTVKFLYGSKHMLEDDAARSKDVRVI